MKEEKNIANRTKNKPRDDPNQPLKDLMALVVAQELYDETLRIICKEDLFPKKSRWLFAEKIANTANDFTGMISYANSIEADTPKLALERHEAQRLAWALLAKLNTLMENAQRHYRFNPNRIGHWCHIFNRERGLLSRWINNDDITNNVRSLLI